MTLISVYLVRANLRVVMINLISSIKFLRAYKIIGESYLKQLFSRLLIHTRRTNFLISFFLMSDEGLYPLLNIFIAISPQEDYTLSPYCLMA